jgi:hypothetical protein
MTRMVRAALLLSLLAACGTAESPDQRACERQANEDPAVKQLILKGVGNPYFQSNSQEELNAAKQQARLVCLRSRGLAPNGGVERQKPLN